MSIIEQEGERERQRPGHGHVHGGHHGHAASPILEHLQGQPIHATLEPPALFRSFWMGGFESACQRNTLNERIDMLAATQHDRLADYDYQLLRSVGMRVARDGVRWPRIEHQAGRYDFSSFLPMLKAAERNGIQVIWNLLHYGWPDDLDMFTPAFIDRFAKYCKAVARVVQDHTEGAPFFCPVNEISFLSWSIGYKGIIHPIALGRAGEVKEILVRAAIAGMEAIWSVDRRARFVHVDPIIYVIPPRDRPDLAEQARAQHESQWHAWDMLAGRIKPELGGHMKFLDIVGVNYYHSNQWETPDVRLHWDDPPDDRRIPFWWMLREIWQRYGRPFFIAETSHFGVGRGRWIQHIAEEIHAARLHGIPVQGTCLYPIIDRPDWEDLNAWHNSGLWDLQETAGGRLERVLNTEYAQSFQQASELLARIYCR